MFLFPLRDDVDVNRQPRGSPFSFFVPSLCLSSSSGLFSPSSSLPIVSSVLVIRVPLSLWKAPPARTQLSGLCGCQSLRRHRRQMQRRSPALQLQRAGARFSSMHSRGAHALPRSGARRVYTWKHATRPSQGRTD